MSRAVWVSIGELIGDIIVGISTLDSAVVFSLGFVATAAVDEELGVEDIVSSFLEQLVALPTTNEKAQ
jgi:hypothetical protein